MQDTCQPQKLEHAYPNSTNENSSVLRLISFDPVVANVDITGFACIDTVIIKYSSKAGTVQNGQHQIN
jgi:hypothetical protein